MENGAMERIGAVLGAQRFAVLCTSTEGWPYASLVAFAVDEALRRVYFATPRNTQKTANLHADGRVALLVDNRSNRAEDCTGGTAVTILGRAELIAADSQQIGHDLLLARHPNLAAFLDAAETVMVCVHVDRFRLVEQFQHTTDVQM